MRKTTNYYTNDQLPTSVVSELSWLERRTGIAGSRVQTLLKSWLSQASITNSLNCVHNCDDHSLLDLRKTAPLRWLARKTVFWPVRSEQFKHFWNWFGESECPGVRLDLTVGSLSKHDLDGSENVIWKCNFVVLQSFFIYSKSLRLKNMF